MELEVLSQSESRVPRGMNKSLKHIPKAGLIFVHICERLKYSRTKIRRIFSMLAKVYFIAWKPWFIFIFATSAWLVVRLHTRTKIWRTFFTS